jgi:hypothetical protein
MALQASRNPIAKIVTEVMGKEITFGDYVNGADLPARLYVHTAPPCLERGT